MELYSWGAFVGYYRAFLYYGHCRKRSNKDYGIKYGVEAQSTHGCARGETLFPELAACFLCLFNFCGYGLLLLSHSCFRGRLAQRAYVLSDAYEYLVYLPEALQHINKAVDLVTVSAQPWLFHHFNLQKSSLPEIDGLTARRMGPVNEALTWAESNQDGSMAARAHRTKGVILRELQDYSGALEHQFNGYEIQKKNGSLPHLYAKTVRETAKIYVARGDYELAIPYYEESLEICKERLTRSTSWPVSGLL